METPLIALSAGHGGSNTGAIAPDGTLEKDITRAVQDALDAMRPSVYLRLRTADEHVSHSDRSWLAYDAGAVLVIEWHCDMNTGPVDGLYAYHWPSNTTTRDLAKFAVKNAPDRLQGGRVISADDQSRWKYRARNVLRAYDCDALLLELGFLSDPDDLDYLKSTEGIQACAELIDSVAQQYLRMVRNKTGE